MVSVVDPGSSGPGSSPRQQGHCVVFLRKTLDSHSAFLYLGFITSCCWGKEPGKNVDWIRESGGN